jgi:hypothetical protein
MGFIPSPIIFQPRPENNAAPGEKLGDRGKPSVA